MLRRDAMKTLAAAGIAAATAEGQTPPARKGRLKQCSMRVNFDPKMPLDEMCKISADLGLYGMDLVGIQDWPTLKKYGLIPTMGPTGGVNFPDGLIHPELHDKLLVSVGELIDQCAAAGVPNLITVGGQRKGMSDEQGIENCAKFLNRIKAHAEDKNVTICMEIMNSKFTDQTLGRPDQICDHVSFASELCKRVNSPRVKMLFDIYHVQTMDGDVVRNIQQNIQWIAHFHTGGVPGRHELDDTQELNYRFVAKNIADLGFTGYIAHEFHPTPGRDPIESLKQAISIISV